MENSTSLRESLNDSMNWTSQSPNSKTQSLNTKAAATVNPLYMWVLTASTTTALCGLWIDLSSFDDYDEFINFCQAIHADEVDPELMAQDYECFPRQWYNEGFISREDFDHIKEYTEMCDKHGAEAVDDYMEFHDELDNFEEAYCGEWDSEEDFARHIVNECYDLERSLGNLADYLDYERFGRELFAYDYQMGANNNVFRVL